MTGTDLLKESMSYIGVLDADETPSPSDIAQVKKTANIMLGTWSAENLMIRAETLENFTLTADDRSYTIAASGADFTTAKPLKIQSAYLLDSGNNRYPLDVIGKSQYEQYPDGLTATGTPSKLFYDPGATQQAVHTGTIYLYVIPESAFVLYIRSLKHLTEISNLASDITLEPVYFGMFAWNLAEWIWPKFFKAKPLPAHIARMAKRTRRVIENLNTETFVASFDMPTSGNQGYDIYTDT